MLANRVQTLPPSFLQDSRLLQKVLQKLSKNLLQLQKQDQHSKRGLTIFLNTFAFEMGINPPSDQQINIIFNYLQSSRKPAINKDKFQGLIKKCIGLYTDSKREPIGGIFDRLTLMLRADALRDKQAELEKRF